MNQTVTIELGINREIEAFALLAMVWYIRNMEPEIVFRQTAFKHHIAEADIRWAVKTARYEELLEDFDGKYLLLGSDTKGNPIEIVYEAFGEIGMCIFHAMKCRKVYLPLLKP